MEQIKSEYDIEVCEMCEGTGEMANFYHDPESNNYYQDGCVKCVCQITLKQDD